jgi:thiol-disulfide isomerase/thioredoxin
MKTLSGAIESLWAMRGKVVVVMFFSTDCGHCHEAAKVLVPLHKELQARGFEMLGVATNSAAPQNLGRFAEVFQVGFPLAVGSRVDWARFGRFPVRGRPPYVPHLLFVDRGGTIRAEFNGSDRTFYDNLEERFRAVVEPLLEEPHPGNPFSE